MTDKEEITQEDIDSLRLKTKKDFLELYVNLLELVDLTKKDERNFIRARIFELLKGQIYTLCDDPPSESPLHFISRL